MERYSRRNHAQAQRHHRVAKREAKMSPQASLVKFKKKGPKLLIAGLILMSLMAIKWFFIGYAIGRHHD